MSYYASDCECVQGIEYFIDPRPYMPSYESPDQGSYKTGYPWVDDAIEEDIKANSNPENVNKNEEGIDFSRNVVLFAKGTNLINEGYVHLTAYQVKSCYIKVKSDDDLWLNGRVSLIFQHLESEFSRTVPVEIGKKIVIPAEVLYPGTLRVALTCLTKTDDYATVLTNSLDIKINDPGIKQANWGIRPAYDVYYHFQTDVKNVRQAQEDTNKEVAEFAIKCLNLETEVETLNSQISYLNNEVSELKSLVNSLKTALNKRTN